MTKMARKTLIQAALEVLADYDRQWNANYCPVMSKAAIDDLRRAAHRRCETCFGWRRHRPGVDHGQCSTLSHNPPRYSYETCNRWKEGAA